MSPTVDIKAWAVFSGRADLRWLKCLKEGYRHCYAVLNDGRHWIIIDPLSGYMDVSIHQTQQNFNLPLWLKNQGYTVVPATIKQREKQAPCMPFSCVEAVKRVLGIHKISIITPWQLYRFLRKEQMARAFQTLNNNTTKGDTVWEV